MKKPVLLAILDGYGLAEPSKMNAISEAKTPIMDDLMENYPMAKLEASGDAVGLPDGQMGNSEVGHLTIGAGRILYTGLSRINKAIEGGSTMDADFDKNEGLLKAINKAKENNSKIHVIGLLSAGGVHSNENHLFKLVEVINANGLKTVVHAITDGRDVDPKSCKDSLKKMQEVCNSNNGILGTICGRFYAMDRDKRWERVEKAYNNLLGLGETSVDNFEAYVDAQYQKEIYDEFIEPASLKTTEDIFLKDNDVVIFANFRPDRARELCHLIYGSSYYDYEPENKRKQNIFLAIMMPYEGIEPSTTLFPAIEVKNTLGTVIANKGLKQLRIAETEKYAHVTFFFDGGVEVDLDGEKKILVNSPKVENYKDTPKMSATTITNQLVEVLQDFDLIILNFANPDMVGHTGDFQAAKEAVEWVDYLVGVLKEKVDKLGGTMFVTADHGNAERMLDEEGKVVTSHTTNKVPFISTDKSIKLVKEGRLGNIAPTILEYMEIEKPSEMTESSLIEK